MVSKLRGDNLRRNIFMDSRYARPRAHAPRE